MKDVINEYGDKVTVDDENKKLYSYNNKKKEIIYNAEIIEDGKGTGFYTNYIEEGIVLDIKQRLEKWDNRLQLLYAMRVGFEASKNDPKREIYKNFVEFVKENEESFFTEEGDFRKKFKMIESDLHEAVKKW